MFNLSHLKKSPPAKVEPPQLPGFQLRASNPGSNPIHPSFQPSQPPPPPRVLEFQFQSSPAPATFPHTPVAQSALPHQIKSTVVKGKETATIVEEEVGSAAPVQNVVTAKTTERGVKRRPVAKKKTTTLHSEEVAIPPSTPTRGMGLVAPPLDNPFSSPGLPPKEFEFMPDKGPQDPSADVPTVSPPSTLLHKQSFPKDVSEGNEDQPLDWSKYQNTPEYVSKHPTCALNLVCYRTGTKGCELHQIQTILESRFEDKEAFQLAIKESPSLIATDAQFFRALRDVYQQKMCGFWRKALFLKTLRGIRLLSFTPTTRPVIVPLNDFILQELLYAYQNPSKITSEHEWIDWVFRLRQPDRRHALEFVEGWNGTQIAVAGSIPLVVSTMVAIVWSAKGSGVQDGFAVAGFILTAGSLLLALLAIISGIESSSGKRNT